MGVIRKQVPIEKLEDGWVLVSTGVVDRESDRVLPSGALLENYQKNPVVMWGHNYRDPWALIGRAAELEVGEEGIRSKPEFREPASESDPMHVIQALWEQGLVRAASIGFRPIEWTENEKGGRDFTSWELLEWSLVPVPANQEALRLAVKAMEDDPDLVLRPYPNEHACRLREPGQFEEGSFRRVSREHEGKEYGVIMGKLKGEETMTEQAYRYPVSSWSMTEARQHCKAHEGQEFSEASGEERAMNDGYLHDVVQKFSGSPRNPFGTHSSYQFKGGAEGYRRAWRLHFSQINGGATTGAATGPIRGTVRRIAMIAAGMKPQCKVVDSEGIGARDGGPSPLEGKFPESPGDYGLSEWKKPESDADREGIRFSCSDLNLIKRAAIGEIKRRAADRDGKDVDTPGAEAGADETLEHNMDAGAANADVENDELTPDEEDALAVAIGVFVDAVGDILGG